MSDTTSEHRFWEFKKYQEHEWFRFLFITLFFIICIYMASHLLVNDRARYEYARLDKNQLQHLNRIYFDSIFMQANNTETLDRETADSGAAIHADTLKNINHTDSSKIICIDSSKCERVIQYLEIAFSNKVDSEQVEEFRCYLCTAKPLEAIEFLGDLRLRVKSYFWLTGPEVYFEIIFWSWFGVISSLLFNLGVVARNRTTDQQNNQSVFDSSEIPYQFAKIGYAPLCTLAIVLGYNYFNDQNIADISSSKGVIVFAFLGGFYSARLIAFLDRLKEVVLPNSGTADLPVQVPGSVALIDDVTILLKPDENSLEPEIINEIAERGLGDAQVTLENASTAKVFTAVRTGEDQTSSFTVSGLAPGKHIVRVSCSKEVNGKTINLVAEQTEDIRVSKSSITVIMKKALGEG